MDNEEQAFPLSIVVIAKGNGPTNLQPPTLDPFPPVPSVPEMADNRIAGMIEILSKLVADTSTNTLHPMEIEALFAIALKMHKLSKSEFFDALRQDCLDRPQLYPRALTFFLIGVFRSIGCAEEARASFHI